MPCHVISNRTYNSLYYSFEISTGKYQVIHNGNDTLRYDYISETDMKLADYRNLVNGENNPCKGLGAGWRVPNIKEVAIMRNLGLLKGLMDGDTSGFLASATFSTFNSDGVAITSPGATGFDNQILVARNNALTQSAVLYQQYRPWYIRCVKDVDP